jgi:hypothetical protein
MERLENPRGKSFYLSIFVLTSIQPVVVMTGIAKLGIVRVCLCGKFEVVGILISEYKTHSP